MLAIKHHAFFHDDAYITLRYARTFAETGLLQWNPGEWVEGYTSVLHVTVTGGLIRLGIPPIAAVQIVNVVSLLLLLEFTAIAARRIAPRSEMWSLRALTIVSVAASAPLALWALGGLEAVVLAAFLAGGVATLLSFLSGSGPWSLALATCFFVFAILTRLDASVFIAGAGLGVLLSGPGPLRKRFGAAVLVVGTPAAIAFLQMGIRLQVYGEVFPLTFYAKADLPLSQKLSLGVPYLANGFVEIPALGLVTIFTCFALAKRAIRGPELFLLSAVLPQAVYIVWAGGDHMPESRMLVPLVAPAALLLLALSSQTTHRRGIAIVTVSAVLTIGLAIGQSPKLRDGAAFVGGIVGRHVAETWPEGITIALNTAGSTPFYAGEGRIFIDMLGLNDPTIAKRQEVPMLARGQLWPGHAKGDGAYVLSRAPDRIIIGPAQGVDAAEALFLSGAELYRLPEFARCYEKIIEDAAYTSEVAAVGPKLPNPLKFTFYRRTCP